MSNYSDSILSASMPSIIPSKSKEFLTENTDSTVQIAEIDTVTYPKIITVSTLTTVPDTWTEGIEGSALQTSASGNSGILTIIVLLFVILSLNFKECKKLFARFTEELRSNKKRNNAFDEHSNHESRLIVLTVVQYLVYGGIILAGIATKRNYETIGNDYSFTTLAIAIAIFTTYYIFQICAYSVIGYTFGGNEGGSRWLRTFNASQSLAGLGLIIPALMTLFYPQAAFAMSIVACIIYFIARLIFISKGFSIFYYNIFSLVYFILYLCALEFIPVIYVYKVAVLLL